MSLARHAVDLTKRQDDVSLDTLAAAHAELGQFDAAVNAAREALMLARAKGDGAMVPELQQISTPTRRGDRSEHSDRLSRTISRRARRGPRVRRDS